MQSNSEETLCAELGRFVVEFEGLVHRTKESIQKYFQEQEFYDIIPVEILTYDSTSSSLAKYFQAISLHYLTSRHSDKDTTNIDRVKKHVNSACKKIIQAGELRNDIVHASWFLSSMYGERAELEANRIKVTADGVTMRKLNVKPGIFENSIQMIYTLSHFIDVISEVISAGALPLAHHLSDSDEKSFNEIDFEAERKKIFVEDSNHFKSIMKDNESMRNFFKDIEKKEQ